MKLPGHQLREQDGGPILVEAGKTFGFEDLVFFKGKGQQDFAEAAGSIDLIITGPHATGGLPEELKPFLAPGITERIQFDFSDHATSALGRSWAESDERIVYIEFPHHRTMYDPNRPPPRDVEGELRTFWDLKAREEAGERVSYNGVDAVRPVSFGGVPFLRKPESDDEWRHIVEALADVAAQGAEPYAKVKTQVLELVVDAKCRRLAELDLNEATVPELASARRLHVQCLHDTMNTTVREDGAVVNERPADDRLPDIVSLGNRGDRRGEPRPPEGGQRLAPKDVPTMPGAELRAVQRAIQIAFATPDETMASALALNQPYLGAYEVQDLGRKLRTLQDEAVVRHTSGAGLLRLATGAYQAEFNRELLLGPTSSRVVRAPGTQWPDTDTDHVRSLVSKLSNAYDTLRAWDYHLQATSTYKPPAHR